MLKQIQTIYVADLELFVPSYRNRLKIAVYNTGIGQREWPDRIQDMLLHVDMNDIQILCPSGEPFDIPLVDDIWKNERYIREFLFSDRCKHPEKDRLIDLYFRVMMPDIARHFGR